jgi:uncharacterized iron-regulated membrane protein
VPARGERRRRGPGPAWRAHVYLALGLALCAAAFVFELRRALGGNGLSWAYVFEWPLLGAFGVYAWWRLRHPAPARRAEKPLDPAFEGMLQAWQEHQEDLARREDARADPADETAP